MYTGRRIHVLTLAGTGCLASFSMWFWSDLRDGPAATFGTIGVFVGLYGAVVTLLEIARTQSAVNLAADEARKAYRAMRAITTVTEITACRTHIDTAMRSLREHVPIPPHVLREIAATYIKVFSTKTRDVDNEHRDNRNLLESFTYSGHTDDRQYSQALWNCLSRLSGHFAQLEADSKRFTELTS